MVKVAPRPAAEAISTRPPSEVISFFTTSMPTPRPAIWFTSVAVENPGMKMNCASCASGRSTSAREQPGLDRLLPDAREVEAAAVVGDAQHHLVAPLHGVDRDLADLGLAGAHALLGLLEAVGDRVPQQVLEGTR